MASFDFMGYMTFHPIHFQPMQFQPLPFQPLTISTYCFFDLNEFWLIDPISYIII